MLQSKHTKQNSYLLVITSPWSGTFPVWLRLPFKLPTEEADQSQLLAICALTDLTKEALPSSFLIEAFWVSTFHQVLSSGAVAWDLVEFLVVALVWPLHPWIFCSFLKLLKNVGSALTILWNCLHERCFKLHTSFNRLETGSTRKISLPFRFVAASRKQSFHISENNHYCAIFVSLLKRAMVLQVGKCLAIFHVPSFYNKLHLIDAHFAGTQARFSIGQTVYFGFINKTFLSSRLKCNPVTTGLLGA